MTDFDYFCEMLRTHNRIVFFGGAGVSTESDIPDFRGTDGLYTKKTNLPWTSEEMLSHHFYVEHPVEFFTLYKEREGVMLKAKPNRAHYALVELEKQGKLSAIITQNIDGLHQKAGSRNVFELHGSILRNICQICGHIVGMEEFISLSNPIPYCPFCHKGILKPDVVLYEEALNTTVIDGAIDAIRRADMLIVGGTSLVVYPAAGFIRYFCGDASVIINKDVTPQDDFCDLVFRNSIGAILEEGVKRISE